MSKIKETSKKRIAWAFCASFCTLSRGIAALDNISKTTDADIIPIASENTLSTDTRFGNAAEMAAKIENITGKSIIKTIKDAEPIGPHIKPDIMVIAPCTGNTLAKIASGITDSTVTMAAKAHLRNNKPLVIALASNDALSANLKNIATLSERKNVYFVPMVQDDPIGKPCSLVCEFDKIKEALDAAERSTQLRPMFL